ncbi:hypothetical protein ACFYWX_13275 [Streptomyces sp. NPDC002888]|uniref:hypothetical protein n=1 Tax=Streptomyces sp. NPDC002888 TaxID=3364668 RepID=UPI0036C9106E
MAGVNALVRRWGRRSAKARYAELGALMWRSLPIGLAVMTLVNLAQLAAHWTAYDEGWAVVLILAGLVTVLALVWLRTPRGIGPVLSAVAVLAGPAACVLISFQLDCGELTGLANWVAGYSVVPILLLPFGRPPEEPVLGVAALVATQAVVMGGAGLNLRDLHNVVLSGGAAATIATGTALLVSVWRQMVVTGRTMAREARSTAWARRVRQGAEVSMGWAVEDSEREAARLLDGLATGALRAGDPAVQVRCREVADELRRRTRELQGRSMLQALLLPEGRSGRGGAEVEDEEDLCRRLPVEERLLLVGALREVAERSTGGLWVTVHGESPGRVKLTVGTDGGPLPRTPSWDELSERFPVHVTHVTGDRWFHIWEMPLRENRREKE